MDWHGNRYWAVDGHWHWSVHWYRYWVMHRDWHWVWSVIHSSGGDHWALKWLLAGGDLQNVMDS